MKIVPLPKNIDKLLKHIFGDYEIIEIEIHKEKVIVKIHSYTLTYDAVENFLNEWNKYKDKKFNKYFEKIECSFHLLDYAEFELTRERKL